MDGSIYYYILPYYLLIPPLAMAMNKSPYYLEIQDAILTNLEHVTNSRFQIEQHQGRFLPDDTAVNETQPTFRYDKGCVIGFMICSAAH